MKAKVFEDEEALLARRVEVPASKVRFVAVVMFQIVPELVTVTVPEPNESDLAFALEDAKLGAVKFLLLRLRVPCVSVIGAVVTKLSPSCHWPPDPLKLSNDAPTVMPLVVIVPSVELVDVPKNVRGILPRLNPVIVGDKINESLIPMLVAGPVMEPLKPVKSRDWKVGAEFNAKLIVSVPAVKKNRGALTLG